MAALARLARGHRPGDRPERRRLGRLTRPWPGGSRRAEPLAAIIANRWFIARRGLVTGLMTASYASGQLVFLPGLAWLAVFDWRWAALTIAIVALVLVLPVVPRFMRDRPEDIGLSPYGADEAWEPPPATTAPTFGAAIDALRLAMRSRTFWLLAGLRGLSLLALPLVFNSANAAMVAFVVVYGLDWVATVPPTSALATAHFGQQAGVVFAWIFAAHQLGAARAAWGAGLIRTETGEYTAAFLIAGALGIVAALAVPLIRAARTTEPLPTVPLMS